jgi:hypothetical protein
MLNRLDAKRVVLDYAKELVRLDVLVVAALAKADAVAVVLVAVQRLARLTVARTVAMTRAHLIVPSGARPIALELALAVALAVAREVVSGLYL